jgi:peptidyl-dipeptidase Dcp
MRKALLAVSIAACLMATACSITHDSSTTQASTAKNVQMQNPLLTPSALQYQAPDFSIIKDAHFQPALEQGIKEHYQQVFNIASNSETPSFSNTIVALETSGELLTRTSQIFYNLTGSNSNPTLLEIKAEMAPVMAAHSDNIHLNSALFSRIDSLYLQRNALNLTAEEVRLIEVYHQRFVLAGAKLTDQQKAKIRLLNEEQSNLTNEFSQRLLTLTKQSAVIVDSVDELAGLSDSSIRAAQMDAEAQGHTGKYLVNITNTTRQPVLAKLENRELRERIWLASANRGLSGENETASLVSRLAQLRAERAALLGFKSWADYQLSSQMAEKPEAVYSMFGSMVPAVIANTEKEAADIQAMINKTGGNFILAPWDWEFYAEKVRQEKFDLDSASIKPYFEFERVLQDGVFFTLEKLYGVTLKPRPDLPVYHEDVKAYEMFDVDGSSIAIFYADYFTREGKSGGAWMSSFVGQSTLLDTKPVVVNVMNIRKAPDGEPTFVSYDEVAYSHASRSPNTL